MKPTVDKDNFPEMVSRPHRTWTWMVRVIFALFVLLPIAALLYGAPVLLYREARSDSNGGLLLSGLYYVLITVLLIWHFKKAKHNAITQIRVDLVISPSVIKNKF
ncbi:hypothetical protein [Sinomicrobium sp. M5D2P17]